MDEVGVLGLRVAVCFVLSRPGRGVGDIAEHLERRLGAHVCGGVVQRRARRRVCQHLGQRLLCPLPHLGPLVDGELQQAGDGAAGADLRLRQLPGPRILHDQQRLQAAHRPSYQRCVGVLVGEGGREAREDVGELGAQQRGRDVGRHQVEQVDGGRGRVLVCDALGGNLPGEQRQQRCEVGRWREV